MNRRKWRPTAAEVDEMWARGFDPETIRRADHSEARAAEADALCLKVRKVFQGVTLGQGIGLLEAQAIDDYETTEARGYARSLDEKDCWEQIDPDQLNACSSSLYFFDPTGMLFHLPVFLIADLRGQYDFDLVYILTHLTDSRREQFSALTCDQRAVVRDYLLFLRADPDSHTHWRDIDRALGEYWEGRG